MSPSYAEVVRGKPQPSGSSSSLSIEATDKPVEGNISSVPLKGSKVGDDVVNDADSESAHLPSNVNTAPTTRARSTTRRSARTTGKAKKTPAASKPRGSRSKKVSSPGPSTVQEESSTAPPADDVGDGKSLLPSLSIGGDDSPSNALDGPVTFQIPLSGCFDKAPESPLTDLEAADDDTPSVDKPDTTPSVVLPSTPDQPPSLDSVSATTPRLEKTIRPHPTLGYPDTPIEPEITAEARRKVEKICVEAEAAAARLPPSDDEQNPLDLVPDELSSDSDLDCPFVDDQAEESDDCVDLGDDEEEVDGDDDYDRDDPFINDGPLSDMDMDIDGGDDGKGGNTVGLKRKRRSRSRTMNAVISSDSEDDIDSRSSTRPRFSDDHQPSSSSGAIPSPPQSLIEKRVQELLRREAIRLGKQKVTNPQLFASDTPLPEGLSDEDRQDPTFLKQVRLACEENTVLAIQKANQDAAMAFKESLRLSQALEGMSAVIPVDDEMAIDSNFAPGDLSVDTQVAETSAAMVPSVLDSAPPHHRSTVVHPSPALPPSSCPAGIRVVDDTAQKVDDSSSMPTSSDLASPSSAEDAGTTNALLKALLQRVAELEGKISADTSTPKIVSIPPSSASTPHGPTVGTTIHHAYPTPETPSPVVVNKSGKASHDSSALVHRSAHSGHQHTAPAKTLTSSSPSTPQGRSGAMPTASTSTVGPATPTGPRRPHQLAGNSQTPSAPSATPGPRRTFKSAADLLSPAGSTLPADLWTLPGNLPPAKLPNECVVSKKYPYGPFLQEHSENLPKLTEGNLVKWTTSKGPGYFIFERWGDQCPDLDFDLTTRAALFRRFHNCVSLTREDPSVFTAKRVSGKAGRYHLYLNNRPALCLSLVYTTKSVLIAPEGQVLRQKYLLGIPMIGDFHRLEAALCMIFHQSKLSAQLGMNALQFATKVDFTVGSSKGRTKSSMFAETSSGTDGNKVRDNSFTLDNTADVPVYDLRGVPDFNFDTDLAGVHRLPRFQGEVPDGSCVSVAYTVSTFITKGKKSVGLNIQFALVLGTPVVELDVENDGPAIEEEAMGDSGEEGTVSIGA
ncbi:hypothetical protein CC2G_000218 [Coprinopsis cinerea AmutBmut pab1-1]|nr:hypothetical protein CC2G_000218 [Coprinopsis cinerea AmutBmut pab1-1]